MGNSVSAISIVLNSIDESTIFIGFLFKTNSELILSGPPFNVVNLSFLQLKSSCLLPPIFFNCFHFSTDSGFCKELTKNAAENIGPMPGKIKKMGIKKNG